MATERQPIVGFTVGGTMDAWRKLLEILLGDPDYAWLMLDASSIKTYFHTAGIKAGISTWATTPASLSLRQRAVRGTCDPATKTRKLRNYDKHLCQLRHRVENAFLHINHWRGLATHHAKNTGAFLAAVHIRRITIQAEIL